MRINSRPADFPACSAGERDPVVGVVAVIIGTVVGLAFVFSFGSVLNLVLRLGVPICVAHWSLPRPTFPSSDFHRQPPTSRLPPT